MTKHRDNRVCRMACVAASALLTLAAGAQAGFTVFEASGEVAASVTPTRDAFRVAVGGGTVAGANGSFGGARREIDWDGVPDAQADPNALPANFFNTTSPRGVVLATPGTGFLVSANASGATSPLFGFSADFAAFSSQRLFTAVNSSVTDVTFFVPGTSTVATTSAFGLIFTDVEANGATKIEFFNVANELLFTRDALVGSNKDFSFLGGVANAGERIGRVRITAGSNTIVGNGVPGDPNGDIVAMDDFLYAEPTAVPEPAAACVAAIAACAWVRRRRTP